MEEIKRNPLPAMECGMAYLAHPYAPVAKSSKVFAKVFAGEIKEANVAETGDIILSGYWRQSRGCMAEYGYSKANGIRIYEYVNGTLYPLE